MEIMKFKKVSSIFVMLILCMSFNFIGVQATSFSQDGLEVRIDLDKDSYQANEKSAITVRVKNKNAFEVTNVNVDTEIPKELTVDKDSTHTLTIDSLAPNETKEYVIMVTKENKTGVLEGDGDKPEVETDKEYQNTIKQPADTADSTAFIMLAGLLVVSGGALFVLKKHKKKSLLLIMLATTLGLSLFQMPNAQARVDRKDFSLTQNVTFDNKAYDFIIKVSYDKIFGEVVENGEVTKEEWITTLVSLMDVKLQNEVEQYSFDDFEEVKDPTIIETAVQYGFLEIEVNADNMLLFEPNAYATREFVAYTTIRALGFVPTQEDMNMSSDDRGTLAYPGEDKIALDFGMLYMIGNSFNPNQFISKVEKQNVIDRTKKILNSTKIDSNHKNSVEYANGVKETTLSYELDEANKTIIVQDKKLVKDWKKGEIHVLHEANNSINDIAIRIISIKEENNKIIIKYEEPKLEEYIKKIDLEGSKKVEGTFTPAEGVEIETDSKVRSTSSGTVPLLGPINIKYKNEKKKIDIKGSIDLKEIEYRLDADFSLWNGLEINEIYTTILNENKVTFSYIADRVEDLKVKIGDFNVPIGYGCNSSVELYAVVRADSSIQFSFVNSNKVGVQYTNGRIRPITNSEFSTSGLNAQMNMQGGLEPAVGLEFLGNSMIKFTVGCGLGFNATWSEMIDFPTFCIDGSFYFYANISTYVGPESWNLKLEKEIFNKNNSIWKKRVHIEETGIGSVCTKRDKGIYEGIVKEATSPNKPISRAKIEVLKDNKVIDSTSSKQDGKFSGIKLSKGSYKLRVSSSGYLPYENNFQITSGENTYLEPQLMVGNSQNGKLVSINGNIKNALTGEVISGATITVRKNGLHNVGEVVTAIKSDADGYYQVNLQAGNYELDVTKDGFIPAYKNIALGNDTNKIDVVLNPKGGSNVGDNLRIVLTWGESPRDLDSHLSSEGIHIYFANKYTEEANLDVDDRSSYGPETISINKPKKETYHYYIHDYTNGGDNESYDLSNSSAQVKVYNGNSLLYTFNIPQGKKGTIWHVFDVDYKTGKLKPINNFFNNYDLDSQNNVNNYLGLSENQIKKE